VLEALKIQKQACWHTTSALLEPSRAPILTCILASASLTCILASVADKKPKNDDGDENGKETTELEEEIGI
jgi:hypothetical protein